MPDAKITDSKTKTPNAYPQVVTVRSHTFDADASVESGSTDSALATCKALTATWYAKRHDIPLERVESHVERDDSQERSGKYGLKVTLTLHGPMTDEQRARVMAAAAKCPIHKLMTTSEVTIETVAP